MQNEQPPSASAWRSHDKEGLSWWGTSHSTPCCLLRGRQNSCRATFLPEAHPFPLSIKSFRLISSALALPAQRRNLSLQSTLVILDSAKNDRESSYVQITVLCAMHQITRLFNILVPNPHSLCSYHNCKQHPVLAQWSSLPSPSTRTMLV